MELSIVGRHALFFDDDANVMFVNSPEALVPWSENPSLLIDRYDARHLLQRISPPPKKNGRRQEHEGDGVSRSDLDRERYLDLPLLDDEKKGSFLSRFVYFSVLDVVFVYHHQSSILTNLNPLHTFHPVWNY